MGGIQTLTYKKFPGYKIKKWSVTDSCGKHFQYAAYFGDKPLHTRPLCDIPSAKIKISDHFNLQQFYRRYPQFKDRDKDGVPDFLDCQPKNPKRQDVAQTFEKMLDQGIVAMPHYPEIKFRKRLRIRRKKKK